MHVTIHMTTGCNMRCRYCYCPPEERRDMSEETAAQTVDFIAGKYPVNTGIIFFGGEPLLMKDMIKFMIARFKDKMNSDGAYFHFKTTTNGLLLDEEFVEYADSEEMDIALSIDGNRTSYDGFRIGADGQSVYDIVEAKARLLLGRQRYTKAMMTVDPDNLDNYYDSVKYLIDMGFRYVIASLNYAGDWNDAKILKLKRQYKLIAKLYEQYTIAEKKFYFSPFDMKLACRIRPDFAECRECHLAQKQISIGFDGKIYPCIQFVKDGVSNTAYSIGDVFSGIDAEKAGNLYKLSKKAGAECDACDYDSICNNKCSCLNYQLTGQLSEISPVVCETERVLIPIADKLGERLYAKRAPVFIQKHYNVAYPILSMIEDMNL